MKTNHKSLSAETYFTWGNEKSQSGDYKGAIADYNTAIQLKPDFARAYYKRGKAKSNSGISPLQSPISKLQKNSQHKSAMQVSRSSLNRNFD